LSAVRALPHAFAGPIIIAHDLAGAEEDNHYSPPEPRTENREPFAYIVVLGSWFSVLRKLLHNLNPITRHMVQEQHMVQIGIVGLDA